MQLHQIKPAHKGTRARRIGRGGKRGTYSGRGIKGQRARAGAKIRPAEREILKKIPKLRGYKFRSRQHSRQIVHISDLDRLFENGTLITPALLADKKLVTKRKGRLPRVKILGPGETKKMFTFTDMLFSQSATRHLNTRADKSS